MRYTQNELETNEKLNELEVRTILEEHVSSELGLKLIVEELEEFCGVKEYYTGSELLEFLGY